MKYKGGSALRGTAANLILYKQHSTDYVNVRRLCLVIAGKLHDYLLRR